eukprot:720138-Rhodomonas_salina.1
MGSSSFSRCLCIAGYRATFGDCVACAAGTYKEEVGAGSCVPCPAGTYSSRQGAGSAAACAD